ncbi:MAG: hypothetical protein KJI70_00660 [Patescibacteria group bacterium]|nr:hypothetical protein [Patescibacteria group bacterium]
MAKRQKRKKQTKLIIKFEPNPNHKEEFTQFVSDILKSKKNKQKKNYEKSSNLR